MCKIVWKVMVFRKRFSVGCLPETLSPPRPYLTHLDETWEAWRACPEQTQSQLSSPVDPQESLSYKASHKERENLAKWMELRTRISNLSSNTRKSHASLWPGLNKRGNGANHLLGPFRLQDPGHLCLQFPSCLQVKSTWP